MTELIELTLPGEHLAEIIEDLSISKYALAKAMGVPPITVTRIIRGTLSITVSTAIKLGMVLDMTPDFWVTLQKNYDLAVARRAGEPTDVVQLVKNGELVAA